MFIILHPAYCWIVLLFHNSLQFEYVFFIVRVCYTESVGVEEDQYPSNLMVTVNHYVCESSLKVANQLLTLNTGVFSGQPVKNIKLLVF